MVRHERGRRQRSDQETRHDIGAVDHGPHHTEDTTKNIQIVLGTSILATFGVVIYAVVLALGF